VDCQLTEARRQLAECQVEAERTRGRLASQVQESGSIEQRIAQNEKDTQDLGLRLDALDEEIGGHQKNVEALEAQIATARERMTEINQQREGLQLRVRERERAIESGRQVILRLLGEASTLKNQLAQIEEYLAGIDRETARATREETVAAAEIARVLRNAQEYSLPVYIELPRDMVGAEIGTVEMLPRRPADPDALQA